ncbi:MAG: hypothetical protein ACYCV4_02425 [Dermatophilaceae bacterium]
MTTDGYVYPQPPSKAKPFVPPPTLRPVPPSERTHEIDRLEAIIELLTVVSKQLERTANQWDEIVARMRGPFPAGVVST